MHNTRHDPLNTWTQAAVAHLVAAQYARVQWDRLATAALTRYGDADPVTGNHSNISGVVRAHFPKAVKNRLRFYARNIGEQTDYAVACWRRAGRRLQTLRPMLQEYRRLPDGRVSYY